MSTPQTAPNRSSHGEERRTLILDATVGLLTREGIGSVTHRAVARESDVPLAATTYYFASKDELITEAVERLVNHEIEVFEQRSGELGRTITSPEALAKGLAELLTSRGEDEERIALAQFEVYLEAVRRPALREAAERWKATFTGLAEVALEAAGAPEAKERAAIMVASIDGLLIHALTAGIGSVDVSELRERVERLVMLLARPG